MKQFTPDADVKDIVSLVNAKGIVSFTDIDANLITDGRHCPQEGSELIATDESGRPTGWLTPKQRRFFDWLHASTEMVPATARSISGFRRVKLPFDSYAICSFGGVILRPDGELEPRWHERMKANITIYREELHDFYKLVEATARRDKIDVRYRIVTDAGLDLFLSVKHNHHNAEELAHIQKVLQSALPAGWTLHASGNFLGLMPPCLGKERAVTWFLQNFVQPDTLVLGMGDSQTDLPFMRLSDIVMMPHKSHNFQILRKGAGLL